MKKTKRNRPNQKSKRKSVKADDQPSRRDFLALAKWGALVAVVVGIVGYFAVGSVQASLQERDLSRLNNGRLTIVQIHDTSCSSCAILQKETRAALKQFDEGALQYLIADLATDEGLTFAGLFGVSYTTLMLFDKEGRPQGTYQGVRNRDELIQLFKSHLDQFS